MENNNSHRETVSRCACTRDHATERICCQSHSYLCRIGRAGKSQGGIPAIALTGKLTFRTLLVRLMSNRRGQTPLSTKRTIYRGQNILIFYSNGIIRGTVLVSRSSSRIHFCTSLFKKRLFFPFLVSVFQSFRAPLAVSLSSNTFSHSRPQFIIRILSFARILHSLSNHFGLLFFFFRSEKFSFPFFSILVHVIFSSLFLPRIFSLLFFFRVRSFVHSVQLKSTLVAVYCYFYKMSATCLEKKDESFSPARTATRRLLLG